MTHTLIVNEHGFLQCSKHSTAKIKLNFGAYGLDDPQWIAGCEGCFWDDLKDKTPMTTERFATLYVPLSSLTPTTKDN